MDLATCSMLIRDARSMLNEHFICSKILSVPRTYNGLAHNLAKLAMSWDPGDSHVWASPLPEFVMSLIARDNIERMSKYIVICRRSRTLSNVDVERMSRYIAIRQRSRTLSHVVPHMIFTDVEERESEGRTRSLFRETITS